MSRVYFTCRRCDQHAHALDDRLGLEGFVSPHAQRLLCSLGADWSFERCARHLRELAGLVVGDNTVRKVCDRHGGLIRAWQRKDPEAALPFREALGPRWRRAQGRLGVTQTAELTVLADGAKWIWNEVEKNLPGATGVLDIYHAGEHLHEAAVALHGADPAAEAWYQRRRRTLLESGASGLLAELAAGPGDVSDLIGYLAPHGDHSPYRARLAEGRSIGSGMVEGACKTAIGRRLKQPGARWKVRRLERMAAVCCLDYGDQLEAYWKKVAG